jgi:poly(3-hydroxyalkanoate) synthetase
LRARRSFLSGKDLVVPLFKTPNKFIRSQLLGTAPLERDMLLYFRGDVGRWRKPLYSRGIKQIYFR